MRSPRTTVPALCLLVLGAAACSDEGATAPDNSLDPAETVVMMEALAQAGALGFFGMAFVEVEDSMARQAVPIDFVFECSGGGTVQLSGTATVTGAGDAFSVVQTLTHNGCTETAPSDGSAWTFNGAPSITMEMSGSASATGIDLQGTQSGAINWSSDGSSGTCQMNVSYTVTGTQNATTMNISGTSCGHDVSQSFTVSHS